MAVEIIQGQIDRFELSTYASIDVYAAGLVLWEILTRTEPPTSQQNTQGKCAVLEGCVLFLRC